MRLAHRIKGRAGHFDMMPNQCYYNPDFLVGDDMKLTSMERTGLRAMVEMARHHGQGPVALSEVARSEDLPMAYLERVAASLRRAGLIESVRGAHGGYMLTHPPENVSVGDVFRAVEGALLPLDCMGESGIPCSRQDVCASRNVWQMVADRLSETLDHTSLADLVREHLAGLKEEKG
jgi:Rrf2 family transcriptional regulator, cysteine metabolism repressor